MRSVKFLLGAALVLGGFTTVGATALGGGVAAASARSTCTGTLTSPGLLSGTYSNDVTVTGYCVVDGGPALIRGDLKLSPGSALNATYALNDVAGEGTSSLTVKGDVRVGSGATFAVGCEPNFSPCSDDPAGESGGTLTGQNSISGDVTATNALAVIAHATTFRGDVRQQGGGGGLSCNPPSSGVFSLLQSPVFSDYEDNAISGDLSVTGLQSCWIGALRNTVKGDFTFSNSSFGDPDASEMLTNVVSGDLTCLNDNPVVEYGDSAGSPNRVGHHAVGQCSFNAMQPNPAPSGPLAPISVRK